MSEEFSFNLVRVNMKKVFPLVALLCSSLAVAQNARDTITIVGSSTVYPFTTTVAERFGKGLFSTPKVESTGTGGGIKLFCAGIGARHPDAVNASRAMKTSEFKTCQANGVTEILELKIGYDGLVIAEHKSGKMNSLTRKEVYLALAKQVPNPSNPAQLIANPYKTWDQINPAYPVIKIEVLGPPPTSGTRDSFVELFMDAGCTVTDEKIKKTACGTIREDGAYIEAGENDNLIVQKLKANPNALGVFGFSFLEENLSILKGIKIDGASPTFETISSGEYVPSRPLFVYVKKGHIDAIPGIKEFVNEYVSNKAIGEDGYLLDKGLIPLQKTELAKVRENVKTLKNLSL
jgi:phosphate transport system substrate-binding protein